MNSKEFTGELSRRLGYTNKDAAALAASLVDIRNCRKAMS